MKKELEFISLMLQTEIFIQDMLITGASIRDLEELLFGCVTLPGTLPNCLSIPTSFDVWKKFHTNNSLIKKQ